MLKIKGHATINVIDATTNEIVRTVEGDNIITDLTYKDIANNIEIPFSSSSGFTWFGRTIFISDETATPVRTKTTIRCMGTATRAVGQPFLTVYHRSNPPYFVITQRISANTGAPRTFNTVGLTNNGAGPFTDPNTTNVTPYSYLKLASPCIQDSNQLLDIVYRVTFDTVSIPNADTNVNTEFIRDIIWNAATGQSVVNAGTLYAMIAKAPLKSYGWEFLNSPHIYTSLNNLFGLYRNNGARLGFQGNQADLFYRNKYYLVTGRDNLSWNGTLVNGISYGCNTLKLATTFNSSEVTVAESDPGNARSAHNYNNLIVKSPMQSAFSYANPEADRGPQFLPSNVPTGTGTVIFNDEGWTGTWPTVYRVRVVTGGNATTAKFVLGVKNFSGFFSDDNFVYAGTVRGTHPYIENYAKPYTRCHGWQFTSPIKPLDNNWTIQADQDGISLINQYTGQHFDYDSTNGLNITNFRQFAIYNNFIYVACSASGLWRINITDKSAPIITNLTTTPAYAVDVDGAGVVYTLLNTTSTTLILTSSASNYTTDLNCIALNTSQWINIYINKLHPDTRIAISVRLNTFLDSDSRNVRDAQLFWWSLASGAAGSVGPVKGCGETQNSFEWVNGSDSRMWSAAGNLLVYGSGSSINGLTPLSVPTIIDFRNGNNPFTPFTKLDGSAVSSDYGVYNYCVMQDPWGNFFPIIAISTVGNHSVLLPSTGASQNTTNFNRLGIASVNRGVAMPNGVMLSAYCITSYGRNRMDNSLDSWIWYKWNGSSWIKAVNYDPATNTFTDTTNIATESRTCSTSNVSLLDNINVRFVSGTAEPSFVADEVYDQYVCNGFLKTNDTSNYLEYVIFYTQPVFSRQTLSNQTINNTDYTVRVDKCPTGISPDPLWYAMLPEYGQDQMFITINGVEVTTVFAETIDTMPTQASLTTGQIAIYRNGNIVCSSSDAGKTLAGFYSYVARSD